MANNFPPFEVRRLRQSIREIGHQPILGPADAARAWSEAAYRIDMEGLLPDDGVAEAESAAWRLNPGERLAIRFPLDFGLRSAPVLIGERLVSCGVAVEVYRVRLAPPPRGLVRRLEWYVATRILGRDDSDGLLMIGRKPG